jgi:hypothetical protein
MSYSVLCLKTYIQGQQEGPQSLFRPPTEVINLIEQTSTPIRH